MESLQNSWPGLELSSHHRWPGAAGASGVGANGVPGALAEDHGGGRLAAGEARFLCFRDGRFRVGFRCVASGSSGMAFGMGSGWFWRQRNVSWGNFLVSAGVSPKWLVGVLIKSCWGKFCPVLSGFQRTLVLEVLVQVPQALGWL